MKMALSFPSCANRFQRRALVVVAFLLLACSIVLFASGRETQSQGRSLKPKAKRVLIISIDGLDARYLNKRDEYGLKIPNLRRLMEEGAAARGVVSVYPSVTYPAHTTIVTGVQPARHGIYGNELLYGDDSLNDTALPGQREWYWFARYIRAETLWDAARKKGLKVGMVSWPVGVGAGDYNMPEIIKFGGGLEGTLARIKENARPLELPGEIERSDPALYSKANRDEQDDMRTRMAEYIITEKRPDVMLIHLIDLDRVEHDRGPFTPEAFAILEKSDAYIGRMVDAARRAGTLDETAVFIVSDHGFMPISKQINPGVLLERAGLVKVREETDAQGKRVSVVTDWRALPFATNGSCAIVLKDENDFETLRKVRAIFRPLAGKEGSGIRQMFEGRPLGSTGASKRIAVILEGADGYSFGLNYTGDFITPNPQRGAHGYHPTRPDYYASFIANGAGINRKRLGIINMIDVGPTIANTLGLTLRDAQGRIIRLR